MNKWKFFILYNYEYIDSSVQLCRDMWYIVYFDSFNEAYEKGKELKCMYYNVCQQLT